MSIYNVSGNRENPTWRILEFLQRQESATIKELETMLGITTTAVRQHLASLQAEGYVERRRVHAGVGRPHHAYSLTDRKHELFACHCDDLALTLLQEVFALEGEEKANQLLERVSARLARQYAASVRSAVLQERVQEMASALHDKGVLSDVDGEFETITLRTYNCPYHELAQEHREICEMDKKMLQEVLGSDVDLSSCLMDGHTSCTFVVSAQAREGESGGGAVR
jgi:predicted ArsR family transcriptional regulator